MKRRLLGTLALAFAVAGSVNSQAQMPGYGMPAPGAGPGYAAPANYMPGYGPAPAGAPAPYGVQPASCDSGGPWMSPAMASSGPDGCGSMCGPAGPGAGSGGLLGGLFGRHFGQGMGDSCPDGSCGGGLFGCPDGQCGGGLFGCLDSCFSGGDSCLGNANGPYGSGGCCTPRWYDLHVEWLYWTRDNTSDLALATEGVLGPVVLNTGDLDFQEQSGVRVTGAYLIGPASALEATYFGTANWADSETVTSNDNLYSIFGGYGADTFDAFPEVAGSELSSVAISTELDNGELNLRHRAVSANCLIHSSFLVGARYLRLRDDMIYFTETNTVDFQGTLDYGVKADNDLVGAQVGTDLYICITPRLKVGAEIEAGVYGNRSSQRTIIDCTSCDAIIVDKTAETDLAFIGEAGAMGLFRLTPRTTLRGGYQVLYIDGVALAADNFRSDTPLTGRTPFVDNSSNILFHGLNVGCEFTW
jgi:hypothetical protein